MVPRFQLQSVDVPMTIPSWDRQWMHSRQTKTMSEWLFGYHRRNSLMWGDPHPGQWIFDPYPAGYGSLVCYFHKE